MEDSEAAAGEFLGALAAKLSANLEQRSTSRGVFDGLVRRSLAAVADGALREALLADADAAVERLWAAFLEAPAERGAGGGVGVEEGGGGDTADLLLTAEGARRHEARGGAAALHQLLAAPLATAVAARDAAARDPQSVGAAHLASAAACGAAPTAMALLALQLQSADGAGRAGGADGLHAAMRRVGCAALAADGAIGDVVGTCAAYVRFSAEHAPPPSDEQGAIELMLLLLQRRDTPDADGVSAAVLLLLLAAEPDPPPFMQRCMTALLRGQSCCLRSTDGVAATRSLVAIRAALSSVADADSRRDLQSAVFPDVAAAWLREHGEAESTPTTVPLPKMRSLLAGLERDAREEEQEQRGLSGSADRSPAHGAGAAPEPDANAFYIDTSGSSKAKRHKV